MFFLGPNKVHLGTGEGKLQLVAAAEHHLAGEGEDQAQGEGAQGLVRFLELLADGDALRAMLLALAALDAL